MKRILAAILIFALLIPAVVLAEGDSELIMPEDKAHKATYLEDENTKTYVNFAHGEEVTLTWTQAGNKVLLEWQTRPLQFDVDYLDANGNVLLSQTVTDAEYMQLLEQEGAYGVKLTFDDRRSQLSTLRAVGSDFELPFVVNSGACDLLVVLAEVGQESLIMGPIFMQYCLENQMDVQVVYLRDATRERIEEGFKTLSALGASRYPLLLEREDSGHTTYSSAMNGWSKKETSKILGKAISQYDPKIIVTLDPLESNEHGQSRLTAEMVVDAVEGGLAPNLKKLYVLSSEGKTCVTASTEQQQTLLKAYHLQDSQRVFRFVPNAEVRLALSFSAVGEDVSCDSIVENIETVTLTSFVTPTPIPTAEPTPEPTPEPKAESTAEPTAEPAVEATAEPSEPVIENPVPDKDEGIGWYVWAIPLAIVVLAGIVVVIIRRKKR